MARFLFALLCMGLSLIVPSSTHSMNSASPVQSSAVPSSQHAGSTFVTQPSAPPPLNDKTSSVAHSHSSTVSTSQITNLPVSTQSPAVPLPGEGTSSIPPTQCTATLNGRLPTQTPSGFDFSDSVRKFCIAAEQIDWDYVPMAGITGWGFPLIIRLEPKMPAIPSSAQNGRKQSTTGTLTLHLQPSRTGLAGWNPRPHYPRRSRRYDRDPIPEPPS